MGVVVVRGSFYNMPGPARAKNFKVWWGQKQLKYGNLQKSEIFEAKSEVFEAKSKIFEAKRPKPNLKTLKNREGPKPKPQNSGSHQESDKNWGRPSTSKGPQGGPQGF